MATFVRPSRLASLERIREVWKASKDASHSGKRSGVDNVTPARFRSRLEENLQRVRDRLLKPDFKFNELHPFPIPKDNGSDRIICIPTVEDRLIQRLLLDYVRDGDKLDAKTPGSYGFQKGVGVKAAVTAARNIRREHRWILKSDITSFFDRIERSQLKAQIETRLRNSSFAPIISAAVDAEIAFTNANDWNRVRRAGIKEGQGLRQGMPLSPLLSNIVLREFDRSFHKRKIPLIRYADDFLILADSEEGCFAALEIVKELRAQKGHTIPGLGEANSKTRIYAPDQAVEFLGLELHPFKKGYKVRIPIRVFEELKKRLQPFHSFEEAQKNWLHFSRAIASLNSKVDGFLSFYGSASNFTDLASHAEHCRENAVRGLLAGVFGADALKNLDPKRQEFLDILRADSS